MTISRASFQVLLSETAARTLYSGGLLTRGVNNGGDRIEMAGRIARPAGKVRLVGRQVFFATLLAGGTTVAVTGLPWKYASTLAISAALSSLVLTVLQYLVRWTDLKFWPDTLARLAKTFLASVAASVAADKVFDITKFDWGTAFDVAFLATISSLGKGLLAREQAQPASPRAATDGAVTAVAADLRTTPSTLPTQTYVEAVKR